MPGSLLIVYHDPWINSNLFTTSSFKSQANNKGKEKQNKTKPIVDFYCLFFKYFLAEETKGTMHLIYVYDTWK